ncbi:MAG: glutathione S-transferase family protein [bacterium]
MSGDTPARFITIGFSHYCEKARWGLDRGGIPYVEEAHPPLIHYRHLRGLGVGKQVPVLVVDGQPMADSSAILAWIDARLPADRLLYPPDLAEEIRSLEDRFDEDLGPATRRLVYAYGFETPRVMVWTASQGVPWLDRVLLRLALPFARPKFSKVVGLEAEDLAQARRTIEEVLAEVDARLADGRRFLVGDRFTAADLTFASLLAPAFLPPAYGAPLPPAERLAPGYRAWMASVADHPSVAFARRLYAEERRR